MAVQKINDFSKLYLGCVNEPYVAFVGEDVYTAWKVASSGRRDRVCTENVACFVSLYLQSNCHTCRSKCIELCGKGPM